MQTSRDLNEKHPQIRVNAVGVGVGLAILVATSTLLSCAPGSLEGCADPKSHDCVCKYTDCAGGGTGGMGGDNGGDGGSAGMDEPPPTCKMWTDTAKFESEFIVNTCGSLPIMPPDKDPPACHNAGSFKPTLDDAATVKMNLLVEETPRMSCKMDPYINKAAWEKSYIVVKTDPTLDGMDIKAAAHCPSNGGSGKARMPFLMAALKQDQYDCIKWYAYKLATE
jgi:hypothetical protein